MLQLINNIWKQNMEYMLTRSVELLSNLPINIS